MYNKQSILQHIKSVEPVLKRYGVRSIGLFGSYIRNEQKADSDIDLLIDFEADKENYDNLLAVYDVLEQLFEGKRVEIITKNGLSPFISPYVLNEIEYV